MNGPKSETADVFGFTTNYRPADLLKVSRARERASEIGTYAYSNANYLLLSMIVEKVTGRSPAAESDRRLFTPLRMKDRYLPTRPPQGIKGPHGHGYAPNNSGKL